jgi:hypothetical protein
VIPMRRQHRGPTGEAHGAAGCRPSRTSARSTCPPASRTPPAPVPVPPRASSRRGVPCPGGPSFGCVAYRGPCGRPRRASRAPGIPGSLGCPACRTPSLYVHVGHRGTRVATRTTGGVDADDDAIARALRHRDGRASACTEACDVDPMPDRPARCRHRHHHHRCVRLATSPLCVATRGPSVQTRGLTALPHMGKPGTTTLSHLTTITAATLRQHGGLRRSQSGSVPSHSAGQNPKVQEEFDCSMR